MMSTKILSAAAALALLLPIAAPGASYAQANKTGRAAAASGAAYYRAGAAPAAHMVGAAPSAGYAAGVPAAPPSGGVAWNGGRTWNGGGAWRGGDRHDHDRDRDRGRDFIPGAVAGVVIGGALAPGAYTYYGAPVYYDAPPYYDDQYGGDGAFPVAPVPVGEDSAVYCAQHYRSYDPASGTYLGPDGLRYPCP